MCQKGFVVLETIQEVTKTISLVKYAEFLLFVSSPYNTLTVSYNLKKVYLINCNVSKVLTEWQTRQPPNNIICKDNSKIRVCTVCFWTCFSLNIKGKYDKGFQSLTRTNFLLKYDCIFFYLIQVVTTLCVCWDLVLRKGHYRRAQWSIGIRKEERCLRYVSFKPSLEKSQQKNSLGVTHVKIARGRKLGLCKYNASFIRMQLHITSRYIITKHTYIILTPIYPTFI